MTEPSGRASASGFSTTSVSLSAMIVALSHLIYVPAIPLVKEQMGVSAAAVAWTIAAFTISQSVAQVLVGPMADRTDGRRLLRIGLVLFLVSNVLILVWPSITGLMTGRVITGFGAGMVTGAGYALVAQGSSAGKQRERALAMYQAVIAVGAVAGPSSGAAIVGITGDWSYVFIVLLAVSAVATLLSFVVPPPQVELEAPAPKDMWAAARHPGVLVMAFVSGVVGLSIMTMHSALTFVFDGGELPAEWLFPIGFAMIPCGVLSGSMLVRHLVQRFAARDVLGYSLVWLGGAIAVFGAVYALSGVTLALFPVLFATGLGLGAGMALSIGVATSLAAAAPGTVSAVVVVVRNLGTTIAPFIVGIAYDAGNLWWVYAVAVALVVTARGSMVWGRKKRRAVTADAVDVAV